jgi:anti-sigma B factor antagonist
MNLEPQHLTPAIVENDGVATVHLTGDADLGSVDVMLAAITEARLRPGVREVVVDLGGVPFMDSSGLGALIAGRRLAMQDGLRFDAINPTPRVRAVMAMTGVLQLLATTAPEHRTG